MVYMGSKRRIKKLLVPLLQEYIDDNGIETYIEPMVGGANIIDSVRCKNRIGYDAHPYLVALLDHIAEAGENCIPEDISRETYTAVKANPEDYPDWYVGLVGFCASFGSKWMAGYAGPYKNGKSHVGEMLRNLKKQAPLLEGIQFDCRAYKDIEVPEGSLVYLDPPYRGTTPYKGIESQLDYEEMYDWLRDISKKCKVLVSEYRMPEDFKVVAEFPQLTQLCADKNKQFVAIEKVFTL